jgi:flagellar basal body P-ring formation protein FlgA
MRRLALLIGCLVLTTAPALAEDLSAVHAKRTLRVGALVSAADVELRPLAEHRAGGVAVSLDAVVGQEVRRNLYVNHPVMTEDVGVPTVVRRNSLVTLAYASGGLELTALGRAIDSAGLHEPIRVVNIDSRVTVVGKVTGPGTVRVGSLIGVSGAAP